MKHTLAHAMRRAARALIGWSTKLDPPVTQFDPSGFRDAGLLAGIELGAQLAFANTRT